MENSAKLIEKEKSKIIKELENYLYGLNNVSIFGQSQENPNQKNKTRVDLIDTFELVSELINSDNIICLDIDENENLLDDIFEKATILDNSYNWNSPLTNEINIHQFENFIVLGVHCGYGDIRGGYFQIILKFDGLDYSENNLITYVIENLDNARKSITIKFDDWINDSFLS